MTSNITIPIQKPRFYENRNRFVFCEDKICGLAPVTLSLCAIVRNCESRVAEWLAFHRLMGVERFFIALHACEDQTEERIRALPFAHDIILEHVPLDASLPQMGAYEEMFARYKDTTRWMIVIDDDEFLFSDLRRDLKEILSRYEAYGGVCVHWRWFGSNNHVLRPDGLTIANYTKRAKDEYVMHRGVKSIIQTAAYCGVASPHLFWTEPVCCTTKYLPVTPVHHWQSGYHPQWFALRIHHYKVKSMEDWVLRARRGDCTLINPKPVNVTQYFLEDKNDVVDTGLLPYVHDVEILMK